MEAHKALEGRRGAMRLRIGAGTVGLALGLVSVAGAKILPIFEGSAPVTGGPMALSGRTPVNACSARGK